MNKRSGLCFLVVLFLAFFQLNLLQAGWSPVDGQIVTRWATNVSPDNVLPEYPRPQMVRQSWQSLNGLWDYAIESNSPPASYQGQILVPFPVQSSLSGVEKWVNPEQSLTYHRLFTVPAAWKNQRVLIHFGAVDWQAIVWVNRKRIGQHRGGYDPFTYDITSALKPEGPQDIFVSVIDPNDAGAIPRGKQTLHPAGIHYTPVTGIWQTVWLEPVPEASINSINITPNLDKGTATFFINGLGTKPSDTVVIEIQDAGRVVAHGKGKLDKDIRIKLKKPKLWAPGSPFLYDVKVTLTHDRKATDTVSSYFGMRKIEIKKDASGVNRMFLNGKALFQFGLLDQGWWPDGLYTAPTDAALKSDIEETLKMGFNLARKHVKVEPERWYYWADKLGLLVWQDMPSGDRDWTGPEPVKLRKSTAKIQEKDFRVLTYDIYEREYRALVDGHYNHPCIVMWVPFNEGWGEFDAERIVKWTRQMDPTRLVDNASGWYDMQAGDVADVHKYPGPAMAPLEKNRASVLGEFGGLGLSINDHLWRIQRRWGYRDMPNAEELTSHYASLINALKAYAARGLAAAVYTQTTDCEGEINGLITYDRAVNKMGADVVARINRSVYDVKTDLNAEIPVVDMPPPPAK